MALGDRLDVERSDNIVGIRYLSPLGPIRFDVGFKLDRRAIGTELEKRAATRN